MSETALLSKAKNFARARLSGKRYGHTLRVADTTERLAAIHELDAARARLAALLHDAARETEPEELLRLARKWKLPVDEFERENPKLLHGPVAAEMARRELGVEDEEVLDAIRSHTTGEPGMGLLALALYVADKIEPARDYPSAGRLRKLAETSLEEAAAEALRTAVAYNEQRGRRMHPASLKTLAWLEKSSERRVE